MTQTVKLILAVLVVVAVQLHAFDDGKYSPRKYKYFDDGKYYRPLGEGKYVPGDEGKYTYVYINHLYPAFPYVHQKGPSGGFGGNGRGNGDDGSYVPEVFDESDRIQYIGYKTYAERFPYIHKIIKALINAYVSTDTLFGETPEGSTNHFKKLFAENTTAVKCQYLSSNKPERDAEFTTEYPTKDEKDKEMLGSFYNFKGTKIVNTEVNSKKCKVKLEYEVIVRIVNVDTE